MDEDQVAFAGITGADLDQARFYLEANGHNLQQAVESYYEMQGAGMHRGPPAGDLPPPPHPPRAPPPPGAGGAGAAPAGPPGLVSTVVGTAVQLPITVVRTGFRFAFGAVSLGYNVVTAVGSRVLPAPVQRTIRWTVDGLVNAGEEEDPTAAAARFKREFATQYGDRHPNFVECGYRDALRQAEQQFKFLLVYLHSPDHQNTPAFCRDVLCSEALVDFIGESFVIWGGDIRSADAFTLSGFLRASTYPYLALLTGTPTRASCITAVEGAIGADQLLSVLAAALEEQGAVLVAARADQEERDLNRRLREEQDAEYQQSLEADRLREEARAAEAEKARKEAEDAAAAEAAARAEEEAAAAKKAAEEAAVVERRARKAAALPVEPERGEGTTTVAVKLPDGTRQQRRFPSSAKMQAVYDYVDTLDSITCVQYLLVTNFPRCEYGQDSRGKSLDELSLSPQAMLFVQPLDED